MYDDIGRTLAGRLSDDNLKELQKKREDPNVIRELAEREAMRNPQARWTKFRNNAVEDRNSDGCQ